jgi:hypothetical protein
MKPRTALLFLTLPLVLAGCERGTLVVVQAQVEQDGTPRPIENLPFEILPYDRDAIFDSLTAAHPEPEPQIPPEMLAQQQQVQQAQAEWRTAEEEWGRVRERMRELSARMEQIGRRDDQYPVLFREFESLEPRERQLQQQMNQAFARFDQLQRGFIAQADSLRIAREAWADRAFNDYERVVEQRLRTDRRGEMADTTGAGGRTRVRVASGSWWVYARYTLPFSELYWNLPITVAGDSVVVELNEATAERRPVL